MEVSQAKRLADSLAGLIRKGDDFDELARKYSADQTTAINGGDLGWFTQEMMIPAFSDSAFIAKKNEVKITRTNYGFHVLQVTDRSTPVEKVLVGIIAKEITPSQQTINKILQCAAYIRQQHQHAC